MSGSKNTLEKIYASIRQHSKLFEKRNGHLTEELRNAKNFFTTPEKKEWTFGKSVGDDGDYHYHGGVAKKRLISLGYKNIYDLGLSQNTIREIEESFFDWAHNTGNDFLIEKHRRQKASKRPLELYIISNT